MANPYASYALPTPQAPLALPDINPGIETLRLATGAIIRACLHATVYYGGKALFEGNVQKKNGAVDRQERDGLRYLFSSGAEMAVSMLWTPTRYLAAVTTPRFLLDYMMTWWSDGLSYIDGFRPGRFASYAVYAFMTNATDEDWNLDFFAWQVPSVVLTITKLIVRRRRAGAAKCRIKRVLGVLFLQVLLRAYVTTFSVMIPESGSQALGAISVTLLEGVTTSYLMRNTWPFPIDGDDSNVPTPKVRGSPAQSADGLNNVRPLRHPSPRPTPARTSNPSVLD